MRGLVASGADIAAFRKLALEEGHRTIYQDGLIKAARGLTTVEEVMRVSSGIE
jgi:general secretion pathway protein E